MFEGTRLVKISPDQRQALCYQCHAPEATVQVGSGDDRTPIGLHEGLSCFACHEKHGQTTRASCSTCHPQLSNCGINGETMDTTSKSVKSPHNVHTVKCIAATAKVCHRKKGRTSKDTKLHEGLQNRLSFVYLRVLCGSRILVVKKQTARRQNLRAVRWTVVD
jgi:hypothetical protein